MIPILIAEDDEHIAKLISFKLKREGFEVEVARNGGEAIEFLDRKPWRVVILDVMMPVHDGWHVLKTMRERPGLEQTPVLMLTAKGRQKDVATAVELGAQQYLTKPFDPQELSDRVKKLAGLA